MYVTIFWNNLTLEYLASSLLEKCYHLVKSDERYKEFGFFKRPGTLSLRFRMSCWGKAWNVPVNSIKNKSVLVECVFVNRTGMEMMYKHVCFLFDSSFHFPFPPSLASSIHPSLTIIFLLAMLIFFLLPFHLQCRHPYTCAFTSWWNLSTFIKSDSLLFSLLLWRSWARFQPAALNHLFNPPA